jgi:uncharacterized protein YdhG (YjbR/CyaY superfamily)
MNSTYDKFDSYISLQPVNIQVILEKIRNTIHAAASDAEEVISYQMPAFNYHGILVYFAACKNHIGFYPTASGIANFKDELSKYKTSKGAVQFPLDKPIPYNIITKIVNFRIKENLNKVKLKIKN